MILLVVAHLRGMIDGVDTNNVQHILDYHPQMTESITMQLNETGNSAAKSKRKNPNVDL